MTHTSYLLRILTMAWLNKLCHICSWQTRKRMKWFQICIDVTGITYIHRVFHLIYIGRKMHYLGSQAKHLLTFQMAFQNIATCFKRLSFRVWCSQKNFVHITVYYEISRYIMYTYICIISRMDILRCTTTLIKIYIWPKCEVKQNISFFIYFWDVLIPSYKILVTKE